MNEEGKGGPTCAQKARNSLQRPPVEVLLFLNKGVMRIKREPRHFFKACKMIWNIISTEITCTNTFRSGLSERGLGLTVTPGPLILNWLNSPAYQTENAHPNSMFSPTSVCLHWGAKPVRRDREWAFKYAGPADAPKAGQRVFFFITTTLWHNTPDSLSAQVAADLV